MSWFGSLYGRLALVMLGLFIIAAFLLSVVFFQAMRITQDETSQRLHFGVADYVVSHSGVIHDGSFDEENIKKAFEHLMLLGPGTELYVLDTQGNVDAYQAPDEKIIQHKVSLKPIKAFLKANKEGNGLPILGDDPRSDKRKVFSVARIEDEEGGLDGYLYIILTGEDYEAISSDLRNSQALRMSFLGMGLGLIFLLLTALILFYAMTQPLKRLNREIQQFKDSNFMDLNKNRALAKSLSSNEVTQLRQSFYCMGGRLVEQLDYLKKHDKVRREFLAYVSHDLRTPLSGIRAYLETLSMKSQVLSHEQQEVFLQKAIVNTDRLADMIEELFELARLDNAKLNADSIMLDQDTLLIADLLSDLYATLAPVAEEKGVILDIRCPDMGLSVHADIARLARVLQNLTENALRYTSKEGKVQVLAQQFDNQVVIQIQDSGQGVSKEDLRWIFQPYYRGEDAAGQHNKGVGLGLAISQRILALHGSDLKVSSEQGIGTVFSFALPVVA